MFSCDKNEENPSEKPPDGKIIEEMYIKSGNPIYILHSNIRSLIGRELLYIDRIGYYYETAFDSLTVLMKAERPGIYFENTRIDTLVVSYNLDERNFISLEFFNKDKTVREIYCILDTKGNLFFAKSIFY